MHLCGRGHLCLHSVWSSASGRVVAATTRPLHPIRGTSIAPAQATTGSRRSPAGRSPPGPGRPDGDTEAFAAVVPGRYGPSRAASQDCGRLGRGGGRALGGRSPACLVAGFSPACRFAQRVRAATGRPSVRAPRFARYARRAQPGRGRLRVGVPRARGSGASGSLPRGWARRVAWPTAPHKHFGRWRPGSGTSRPVHDRVGMP